MCQSIFFQLHFRTSESAANVDLLFVDQRAASDGVADSTDGDHEHSDGRTDESRADECHEYSDGRTDDVSTHGTSSTSSCTSDARVRDCGTAR